MTTKTAQKPRLPVSARYEFEAPLGTGGMGTVYRALDRRTNALVAIKVLKFKQNENPTLHQRLAREFKAASELEHPNIVQALAFENDGELSYLVYELVEGGTVADRLEKHGCLPEDIAVRIITQIAQALQYAHDHHVIHRDVKPDNIMLSPNGKAKLTDFGLAKDYEADEDLTRQASGLGTPHFMAPEQFADAKNVDARCDIYSLGATLYNFVTGRLPFDAKTALAMLTMKEMCKYRLARSWVPSLSERVDVAIRAALDPDIDKRPASCLEFFKLLTGRRRLRGAEVIKTPAPVGNVVKPDRNRRAAVRYSLRVGELRDDRSRFARPFGIAGAVAARGSRCLYGRHRRAARAPLRTGNGPANRSAAQLRQHEQNDFGPGRSRSIGTRGTLDSRMCVRQPAQRRASAGMLKYA